MAGERTPDTSPHSKAGSSDDEISLREHLQRQLDLQRDNGLRMFDEFRQHYNVLLDQREQHWMDRIGDITRLYDERYERQTIHSREQWDQHTHATEVAFEAATAATDTAFKAADRAIQQAHEATNAAIGKVERALDERFNAQAMALAKAESATEKRFDAVNEFRAQQADLITRFMPRAESEVRVQGLAEKLDANGDRINKLELRVSSRLDLADGKGLGIDKTVAWIFAAAGFVSAIVAITFSLSSK